RDKTREAKRRMDRLRIDLAAFLDEQRRLEDLDEQTQARQRQLFRGFMIAGAAASLLASVGLALFFSRGVFRRISLLSANLDRLGQGQALGPAVGGSDELTHLDEVLRDVAAQLTTSRRQLEEANERLERRVEERTADLSAVNRELFRHVQENETFVYSVSHDLRSPLINLQGFSRELTLSARGLRELFDHPGVPPDVRQRGHSMLDGEVAESTRFITAAVSRLGAIIDALLRLSRAGRVEYRMQAVDLNGLAARAVEALSATARERGAAVEIHPLPRVLGDPTALEQVL